MTPLERSHQTLQTSVRRLKAKLAAATSNGMRTFYQELLDQEEEALSLSHTLLAQARERRLRTNDEIRSIRRR